MDKIDVTLELNGKSHGAFVLKNGQEKIGEMVVAINDGKITVYHTEVNPEYEGKGLSRFLLEALVSHAREHKLMVLPLCTYVHGQFTKHPEKYEDIWLH